MIRKTMLSLTLLCQIAINAIGQSNFGFNTTDKFKTTNRFEFYKFPDNFLKLNFLTKSIFETTSQPLEKKILKPIEPYKYEAFFCRIEQQMCNRFDVWIKVRVGDESSYHWSKAID